MGDCEKRLGFAGLPTGVVEPEAPAAVLNLKGLEADAAKRLLLDDGPASASGEAADSTLRRGD